MGKAKLSKMQIATVILFSAAITISIKKAEKVTAVPCILPFIPQCFGSLNYFAPHAGHT